MGKQSNQEDKREIITFRRYSVHRENQVEQLFAFKEDFGKGLILFLVVFLAGCFFNKEKNSKISIFFNKNEICHFYPLL